MTDTERFSSHILQASSAKQAKFIYNKAVARGLDLDISVLDSSLRQRIGDGEFFKYLVRRDRKTA